MDISTEDIPLKLVGGIALLAIVLVGGYFLWFSGPTEPPADTLRTADGTAVDPDAPNQTQVDTTQILRQLNQLRRISINTDFFSSSAFSSLKDFSVRINKQPIGRENPFVPSTYVPEGSTIVPNSPSPDQPTAPPEMVEEETATTTATTTDATTTSSTSSDSSSTSTATTTATTTNESDSDSDSGSDTEDTAEN